MARRRVSSPRACAAEIHTRRTVLSASLGPPASNAARSGAGAYLIELYADERSADPAPAATRLQLLLRLAAAAEHAS